jgi:hypothetical protein
MSPLCGRVSSSQCLPRLAHAVLGVAYLQLRLRRLAAHVHILKHNRRGKCLKRIYISIYIGRHSFECQLGRVLVPSSLGCKMITEVVSASPITECHRVPSMRQLHYVTNFWFSCCCCCVSLAIFLLCTSALINSISTSRPSVMAASLLSTGTCRKTTLLSSSRFHSSARLE